MMSVKTTKVFKKLILSHTVIILIVSILLGCASFLFFNWNYNEEIKKYNEQMLSQKKMSFQTNIISKLTETSYSILSNFQGRNDVTRLFDGPVLPSDWKITQAYIYLQNIIAQNSNVIESISIYCYDNRLFLSTVSGVNHMDSGSSSVQWMAARLDSLMKASQHLVYDRPLDIYSAGDTGTSRIMLYSSYPLSPLSGGSEGLLCIAIRNTYLDSLLNDNTTDPLTMTFLLSEDGRPVNNPDGLLDNPSGISDNQPGYSDNPSGRGSFLDSLLQSGGFLHETAGSGSLAGGLAPDGTAQNFLFAYGGSSYVVSVQCADGPESPVRSGFRMITVSLTDSFHGRSSYFVWFLAAVCIGVILIGLLIAYRLSKSLYRPLKETVTKITRDLPAPGTAVQRTENEYSLIDDYISILHQKASSNRELIYHTVIGNLLTAPLSVQEIEKQLFSAGIEFTCPYFLIGMAEFDDDSMTEGAALSFLSVTEELRLLSDDRLCCHAVFQEGGKLGFLINASEFPDGLPQKIHHIILETCGISCRIYYSSRICDVGEIHGNYATLLRMKRYTYFFPDRVYFDISEFYKKDLSVAHLSTGISAGLASLIRTRKKDGIRELLSGMRREIEARDYSYETCNSRITKMIYILSEYIKEVHLEKEFPLETVHHNLTSPADICEFTEKYLETLDALYQMADDRSQSQGLEVVRRIQDYILDNLQNDISLDVAAGLVSLSPQYVSRLFRDGIGITFVAFIKKCKMEKARELLLQNDLNVDQVAEALGFNSTAYFIKNFKDAYGITPKAFQRQGGGEVK